jgi:acetyl esterase/lipase
VNTLEPAAAAFAAQAAARPTARQAGVAAARRGLEDLQSGPSERPRVDVDSLEVDDGEARVTLRIVRPPDTASRSLPVVLYLHGGGWILGSASTHDRLVRELSVRTDAAVAFVEYDRSPEVRYPVALDQGYAAARWICERGADVGLDGSRMAVAGDSAGGNLAAALAIRAQRDRAVTFVHQALYYPVTDAGQDTASYREFANGPHLTADTMAWFWDAYLPDLESRNDSTASPLRADAEELRGLPDTSVVVAECDVLRDEGEAYARRLVAAGVRCSSVRCNATIHDFLMLDALRDTAATRAGIAHAIHELRSALHGPAPSRRVA